MVYIDLTNMDMTHNLKVSKVCLYSLTLESQIRNVCLHEYVFGSLYVALLSWTTRGFAMAWSPARVCNRINSIRINLASKEDRELNPLQLIPCKKCVYASNILHFGRT